MNASPAEVAGRIGDLSAWDALDESRRRYRMATPLGDYRIQHNTEMGMLTGEWRLEAPDGEHLGWFREPETAAAQLGDDWERLFLEYPSGNPKRFEVEAEIVSAEQAANEVADAIAEDDWKEDFARAGRRGQLAVELLGLEPQVPVVLLSGLEVRKEHRGQGLGREIVEDIERWGRERGAMSIVLHAGSLASSDTGTHASGFWSRLGFAAHYESPWGDQIMTRALPAPEAQTKTVAAPESNPVARGGGPLGLYSPLARALQAAPARLDGAGAGQWREWLQANAARRGIRADELEWSGLLDYLKAQGGPIRKNDLHDWVRENGVRIREVQYGRKPLDARLRPEFTETGYQVRYNWDRSSLLYLDGQGKTVSLDDLPDSLRDAVRRETRRYQTESEYQTPFRTADEARDYLMAYHDWSREDFDEQLAGMTDAASVMRTAEETLAAASPQHPLFDDETRYAEYVLPGGRNYREVLLTLPPRTPVSTGAAASAHADRHRSPHWSVPDVLVHLRMDEREGPQGERALFVQEIQSDWAQTGRREGFVPMASRYDTQRHFGLSDIAFQVRGEARRRELRAQAAQEGVRSTSGVAPGPFVTETREWVGLALKRALVMAAEEGLDYLVVANGADIGRLYDLERHVDAIRWLPYTDELNAYGDPDFDSVGELEARRKGEQHWSSVASDVEFGKLDRYIGKSLAKRLSDYRTGDEIWSLEGGDLKIESAGLRSFYDRIVPQVANYLLKPLGARSRAVEWPRSTDDYKVRRDHHERPYRLETRDSPDVLSRHETAAAAWQEAERRAGVTTQTTIVITPELRERILREGLPLFGRPAANPELRFRRGQSALADSPIADAEGEPLMLYHGSPATFDRFDFAQSKNSACSFTPSRREAARFGTVRAYHITARDPLEISQDDLRAAWSAVHPDGLPDERGFEPKDFIFDFVDQARRERRDLLVIRHTAGQSGPKDIYLPLDERHIHPVVHPADALRRLEAERRFHFRFTRSESPGDSILMNPQNSSFGEHVITLFQSRQQSAMATKTRFSVAELERHLEPVSRQLTVPILVHPHIQAANAHIGEDLPGDTQGVYADGQIHVIASNHHALNDVESTVWHEVLHAGIDRAYQGDATPYHDAMHQLYQRNAALRTRADHWAQQYGMQLTRLYSEAGMAEDRIPRAIRSRAVEEILSEMSEERGGARLNGWNRFTFGVTQVLRSMKLEKFADAVESVTDAEALHVLHQTRTAVLQESRPVQATRTPAQHRMRVEQREWESEGLLSSDIEEALKRGGQPDFSQGMKPS